MVSSTHLRHDVGKDSVGSPMSFGLLVLRICLTPNDMTEEELHNCNDESIDRCVW